MPRQRLGALLVAYSVGPGGWSKKIMWHENASAGAPHFFKTCYVVAATLTRFLAEQVKTASPGDERFGELVRLQCAPG